MAVLVSPLAGTNLSTASGFLKAEAYNLGLFSATDSAALSTPKDIALTFTTGSRTNNGVILALETSSGAGLTDRSVRVSLQQIMGTVTMTIANPCVVTFTSHGFSAGQAVQFSTTGALPTFSPASTFGATVGTVSMIFYAGNIAANTFNLYDTAANAITGGATGRVTTSGTQSGTHTLYADRGISEQSLSTLYNGSSYKYGSNICDFPWTGVTIDTTASKWRYHIFQYGGTQGNVTLRTSDATNPFHCEISGITATAATNDTLVCYGPVTVDTTFTAKGTLGTGETAYAPAIVLVKSASAMTPTSYNESLKWDGSAARTLTIDGCILMAFHGAIRAGTSASRISAANMGTIAFTVPSVGTISGFVDAENKNGAGNSGRMSLFVYGERPSVERTTFVGNIATSATSFTTADSTGWVNGDKIALGKLTTKGADANVYTVSSTSGTTVTLTGGITGARTSGGAVIRLNGYGFKITGPAASSVTRFQPTGISNLQLDGVELANFGVAGMLNNYSPTEDTANRTTLLTTHCSCYTNIGTVSFFSYSYGYIPANGFEISYCNFQNIGILNTLYMPSTSGVFTFNQNRVLNAPSDFRIVLQMITHSVCTNNVFENGYLALAIIGYDYKFTGNKFWGNAVNANNLSTVTLNAALTPSAWSGNTYDNCTTAITLGAFNNMSVGPLVADVFGAEVANSVDIQNFGDFLHQLTYYNSVGTPTIQLNAMTSGGGQRNMGTGSYIRFKNYNATTNDYRAYYRQGRFINPSQGASIQQISNRGDEALVNNYNLATQAVSGFKHLLALTGQIANAAYYGGTYTLPKAEAIYDSGTSAATTLSANTAAQSIANIFTPTTNNSDIVIRLTTQSDAQQADTTNLLTTAAVTWSNCVINVRKYGYQFGAYPITINQTTESYLATIATPAANPYITQATQATVDAYTGMTIDHNTQTVTLTASHSLKELYDYSQSNLTADANMGYATWFTTLDGSTYTSAYNIVLNGGDLTGGGSVTMASGKTFTKTSGSYDGTIINADGTRQVHLLLTGIVAGSRVQLYDTTASAELYNGVPGTTEDYIYTYSGSDHTVRIRVAQPGYLFIEATATAGSTGFNYTVAQTADDVYTTNAIDGSTVTEFSVSGAVIETYINDPDNATSIQRLYNWWQYMLSTAAGIADQGNYVRAVDSTSYKLYTGLKLYNSKVDPLVLTGGYFVPATGGTPVDCYDTAGGPIFMGYPHVVPFLSGSGLSTDEHNQLMKSLTVGKFLALK